MFRVELEGGWGLALLDGASRDSELRGLTGFGAYHSQVQVEANGLREQKQLLLRQLTRAFRCCPWSWDWDIVGPWRNKGRYLRRIPKLRARPFLGRTSRQTQH